MSNDLIELAKTCSADTQSELAEHVTTLLDGRTHIKGSEETGFLNDMLVGVYDGLQDDTRQTIADRLASSEATSATLAATLASDDLPIAQKALTHSHALREADLLQIARSKGQGHLLAIAKRSHVSKDLSGILIERGGPDVKQTIAANLGAEIDNAQFDVLVKDLPKQLGERVRHLRKSNQELIEDLFRDDDTVAIGAPLEKKPSKISTKAWAMAIKTGKTTLNKAIYQISLDHNLLDIVVLLGFFSGLDAKYVHKLMVRFDATGIATVCRAAGVNAAEFQSICKERCKHLKLPATTGSKWVTNYHMLDTTDAERLLALMKAQLKAGPTVETN